MDEILEKTLAYYQKHNYSLVLKKDNLILYSSDRSIKTLRKLVNTNKDFSNFAACDNVVGKGAAFLYLFLNIKHIYTPLISVPALRLLAENGVQVVFEELVENIINVDKTDLCPMEKATLNINNKEDALKAIDETSIRLAHQQNNI